MILSFKMLSKLSAVNFCNEVKTVQVRTHEHMILSFKMLTELTAVDFYDEVKIIQVKTCKHMIFNKERVLVLNVIIMQLIDLNKMLNEVLYLHLVTLKLTVIQNTNTLQFQES